MLPAKFYQREATSLARALLGQKIVSAQNGIKTSGLIVETEAYLGTDDAAANSYRGETPRTAAMFGPGGHAYIYFTYGMHYCFNVVANRAGIGQAVLVRALQPTDGVEEMQE